MPGFLTTSMPKSPDATCFCSFQPYFVAMTISDMINSIAMPTLYGVITYLICNLRPTASAFFTFVLIMYMTISAAQSMGLFLSVLIPNTKLALLLAPAARYLLGVVFAVTRIPEQRGMRDRALTAVALVTMHLSWGAGFLRGGAGR